MWLQAPPPPPVIIQAYTESLCIDCKNFVQKSLVPTYNQLGPSVINLHIVPFGNSQIDKSKHTVKCQHGNAERDANSWQQCAVEKYDADAYLPFFACLEDALPMGSREEPYEEAIFQKCASSLDFEALKNCHDNPLEAWLLQEKYSDITPDHDYVPWVFIDGEFYDDNTQDFQQAVCNAYARKGGSHPGCESDASK